MAVEELDVALQVVGVGELVDELVDDALLGIRELEGVRGVEGGEVARHEVVGGAVDGDRAGIEVNLVEQKPVFHVELGMAQDDLPLELEEQHVDGLQERIDALAVRIGALRERHELAQRDAVVVLEDLVVLVAQVVAQHGDDAGRYARGGAHPQDVVVAPLDIGALMRAAQQPVHDLGRPAAAVEDVADQMDVVDREHLDELGERADEVLGGVGLQDGIDDALVIAHAVVVLVWVRVQQLIDDVGEIVRDGLADLRARVAAGEPARDGNETVEHGLVPGGGVQARAAHELDLLTRVVDERAQVALFLLGERVAEVLVHVLADDAGAVVEDVQEGLVLAMQVAHEVLGALGQVENGLQVDDLGEHCALVAELLG